MILTPAIKGQLTKVMNKAQSAQQHYQGIKAIFTKHMPAEQAKHATRRYLSLNS